MPTNGPTWIYCRPYVQAMDYLTSWDDRFGPEGGREIVMRFLENAGTWRGRDAQRLKAELRAAIGMKVAA